MIDPARAYQTVNELARHWGVSRKQVIRLIRIGALPAIRLSPRTLRVRTTDALAFEHLSATRASALT